MGEVEVRRFADSEALEAAAAANLVAAVVSAQSARGRAAIVLTGGGTGIGVLRKVRENPGAIDWSTLDLFWGDERFLPAGDPERNEVQAHEALLDHVDIDPARVHPMPYGDGLYKDDPDAAAVAYEHVLGAHADGGQVPAFDVHLLGMGGEGHINSLFPDTDAVRETDRAVVAVVDSPKPPPVRITLTLPAVRQAKQVWLLVTGESKAEAVAAAINGASPVDVPAAGATGSQSTVWFLDNAAAGKLEQ